jgi:hypothetical protein
MRPRAQCRLSQLPFEIRDRRAGCLTELQTLAWAGVIAEQRQERLMDQHPLRLIWIVRERHQDRSGAKEISGAGSWIRFEHFAASVRAQDDPDQLWPWVDYVLGMYALVTGKSEAYDHFEQALAGFRQADHIGVAADLLHRLGFAALQNGDLHRANQHLQECLQLASDQTIAGRSLVQLVDMQR